MTRYFFNLADGGREPDSEGVELDSIEQAHVMAATYAGELLRDRPRELWRDGQWRVEVTDVRGVLRCTLITLAIDAPSPERQAGIDP